ncbi:hypothetical protein JDV02_003033 [Purpureocillium takamizusanense]|uniref:CFEM domain-containing protein n=1 Tax=Purpureocillium takamizusanense TaxID=2060973 RepID=A0A9Q8QCW2_9HYPO|nr:uncharacterized protein JDV02_003033 [Purpureocillium takamizusanense]UNI16606.1 hypothetical protein JDV02_003033 [Purpureocillium takamizusanense]
MGPSLFSLSAAAALPQWLGIRDVAPRAAVAEMNLTMSLPTCAAPCLASAAANATCTATDLACICSNPALQDAARDCVQARCPFSDVLAAINVTQTACGAPVRDKTSQINDTIIPLGVVTLVIVIVRLVFKRFFSTTARLGSDDWAIAGTVAICIAGMVIGIDGLTANGIGKDVWTLTTKEVSNVALYLYILEILYFAGMSLIKLSLSLFYLHIFSGPIVRKLLWATVVFNILYGFAFVLAAIFQCSPIDYYWRRYLDAGHGTCVNINIFGWLNAAIGVAIDLWMIGLPLSQVIPLRLHWKKKIGVAIMFLLGTFVTVVSILRLQSLILFANSNNPTWDQWETAYWSIIEVNVGMICTCLPSLRLILVRLFPKIFGSSRRASYEKGNREPAASKAGHHVAIDLQDPGWHTPTGGEHASTTQDRIWGT